MQVQSLGSGSSPGGVWGPKWETLKKMGYLCRGKLRWRLAEEIGVWSMLKFLIGSLDFRARG